MEQDRPPNSKAKLTEVNSYLTCYLCKGYYIDATTIVECLHSFCRSCIIQFLQQDPFCPICDLMINMAKPQIKPDKTLQDIVYKLVPGLYASEMCRRRKFWAEHSEEAQRVACPEAKGLMTERIIFSPQDAISLSIEYTSDDETAWNHGQPNRIKSQQQQLQQQQERQPSIAAEVAAAAAAAAATATATNVAGTNSNSNSSEPDPEIPLRRYLQCPAMLRVEHLKKFICNKYSVDNQQYHIDILYKRVPLPDHYTLMDIAYIYSWKRNEPMKFYFRITDIALAPERFDYFEPSSLVSSTPKQPTKSRCHQQRSTKQQHLVSNHNNNNNNNNTIVKKSSPIRADNEENTPSDNKPVNDNQMVNNAVENTKNTIDVKNNKNCDKVNKTVKCKTEKQRKTVEKEVKQVKNECATDKKKISDNKSEIKLNNLVSSEKENIPDNNDKSDTANNEKCRDITDNDKQIKENSDKCEMEKRVKEEVFKIKSEPNYDFSSDVKSDISCVDNSKNDENISNTKLNVPITIKSEMQTPDISVDKSTENPSEKSFNKTDNSLLGTSEEDVEKSNFLKSIQLTARSSLSPPNPNPNPSTTTLPKIIPPIIKLKLPVGQKRKYVRKNPKEPNAKKAKIENIVKKPNNDKAKVTEALTKMRRIAPKATKTNSPTKETDVKVRSIKNPIVRMIVSNMNKQSTNLNKIVGQTNETERLKSLIDSCKLNIPSSLSITLTESPRNEDGTIVETKPAPIKPVQNYIEILKLPETNVPSATPDSAEKCLNAGEVDKKPDTIEKLNQKMLDPTKNGFANMTKTQKQTFQTMFEEAIKRNESMKAQLFHIQNQAKNAEIAKKAASNQKSTTKKQQSNALDLSSKTSPTKIENGPESPNSSANSSVVQNLSNSNLYVSTSPTRALKSPGLNANLKTISSNSSCSSSSSTGSTNGHISSTTNVNANGKRNILEIAHQLSKRSKLESETSSLLKIPNSSVSPNPTTSRVCGSPSAVPKNSPSNPNSVLKSPKKETVPSSPPKQIIINNNFSSGGSISIKDSPKKVSPAAIPKLPIPRLPVQKVPTPKLTMPIRNNNGLLKFSNYTAKLANSTSATAAAVSSSQTSPKPNSTNVSPNPKIPETSSTCPSPSPKPETIHGMTPNQILEKYNITNLAQFNANLNHAQLAFQQALMVSHQLEMHRLHQQTNQKQWMNNPNILAHYENYVKSLKQQNQMCGNASKN